MLLPLSAHPRHARAFKHVKSFLLWELRKLPNWASLSLVIITLIITSRSVFSHSFFVVHRGVWVPTLGCYGLSLPRERVFAPVTTESSRTLGADSGFCLCDAFWIVEPKNCGHGPLDCEVSCRKKELPPSSRKSRAAKNCSRVGRTPSERSACPGITRSSFQDKKMFSDVQALLLKHHLRYTAPGTRSSRTDDYVLAGKRMRQKDLEAIRRGIQRFVESIPAFGSFEGRGIVIVGGSKKAYQTPYWIAIFSIRRVDHNIPIELWFPKDELPNCLQLARLAELQVNVRTFEDIASQTATKHSLSGYAYKIVALTFSSFEEVLLLDADNVVMRSPRQLFESEQYKYTGSLLWKDFWLETRAPEASMIGAKALPGNNTHESGQLLVLLVPRR